MAHEGDQRAYSIGDLATLSGVTRRTIRFYVQRGLIDPPVGKGRGSYYTREHLEQIQRVRGLQREGLPLDTIQRLPGDAEAGANLAAAHERPLAAKAVLRVPLAPGVRLEVDAEGGLPDARVLDALAQACEAILKQADE